MVQYFKENIIKKPIEDFINEFTRMADCSKLFDDYKMAGLIFLGNPEKEHQNKALKYLTRYLRTTEGGTDYQIWYYVGLIEEFNNNIPKAIDCYNKVILHRSDHLESLFNIAEINRKAGFFEKAAYEFQNLIDIIDLIENKQEKIMFLEDLAHLKKFLCKSKYLIFSYENLNK